MSIAEQTGKVILFQGDSITDASRGRGEQMPNVALGQGYVSMVAGRLLAADPTLRIYNRGIGGNRIGDGYARWHEDTLNIPFDVLSVFFGINDVGFDLRLSCGACKEEFAFMYDHMLEMAKERRPAAALVLCQPFVLPVDNDWPPYGNDIFRDYAVWRSRVEERAAVVEELAARRGARFARFGDVMYAACEQYGAAAFSTDGVHPNAAGAALLAQEWLRVAGDLV